MKCVSYSEYLAYKNERLPGFVELSISTLLPLMYFSHSGLSAIGLGCAHLVKKTGPVY